MRWRACQRKAGADVVRGMNPLTSAVTAIAVVASLASCSAKTASSVVACDQLEVGHADGTVVLLTDSPDRAFLDAVATIADDPHRAFQSKALGLHAKPGVVVVAGYDVHGQVRVTGKFNLGGTGSDPLHRQASARAHASCLRAAAKMVTGAPGGDLLRALPTAAAIGDSLAESKGTTVVAFGLGRSGGDGFKVASADLGSTESRRHVLGELARVGLLPHLDAVHTNVVLTAPDEGVTSGIAAAGIRAFAGDLCKRLAAATCHQAQTLSVRAR